MGAQSSTPSEAESADASLRRRQLDVAVVRIASSFVAVGGAIVAIALIAAGVAPLFIVAAIVISALSTVACVLSTRGQVRAATVTFYLGVTGALLLNPIVYGGGVHMPGIPAFVLLIVFSGYMLGPRGAYVSAALNVAIVAGLYWAERAGYIPGAAIASPHPGFFRTVLFTVVFVLVGALTARYARVFTDAISRLEATNEKLRLTQEALERAHAQALSGSQAKSRFLANMSHEIRTPLNGIIGMAQMLDSAELGPAERAEYLRTILNSGRVLLALLNDILDMSKIEAGKLELDSEPFDPAALMRETSLLFDGLARAKGLKLSCSWTGPAHAYLGDPLRLRQMLYNLTNNAIKFTEAGEILVLGSLDRQSDEHGGSLEFSVKDTGIGIPGDKLPLLFRPFSQVDSSHTRHFEGTGLGLSIVRSLVAAMNGTAGVESTPGKGSRFWLRIPAVRAADGAEALPSEAATHATETHGVRARVLVVEDNAVNKQLMQAMLRKLGHEVHVCDNGRAALEFLAESPEWPDVVLMDCHMPVMDGYDATRALRARERESGAKPIPILALTAAAYDEDRERCMQAGMNEVLTKPLLLASLTTAIEVWVAKGRTGSRA